MINYRCIGLTYTLTCPLSCRDCINSSSPKAKGKMQPDVASEYIKTIARYSEAICFTGGEPMLYYNEILPLIREANALGLNVSLVSGSGWVRTDKAHIARERIYGLKEAGLTALFLSWDVYHEEFSPAENVHLLLDLAKEAGLKAIARGVVPASKPSSRFEETLVNIDLYEKIPVIRLGAAMDLPDDHFTFTPDVPPGTCSIVLSPTIEPDGTVYTCCGPSRAAERSSPLVLGNTSNESLETILHRGARDPILEAIFTIGPYGLMQLIKDDPELRGILPKRDRYTSMCEACLDMNDIPAVVDKLRERIASDDGRTLLIAAKLFRYAPYTMRTNLPPIPASM